MRNDDISKDSPGIKELKELTDMWGPHVSEMAHGELGSPNRAGSGSGEVARPRTCGANAAPHGLTRTQGAEVALTRQRHVRLDGEGLGDQRQRRTAGLRRR